jgi:hypothetical protein
MWPGACAWPRRRSSVSRRRRKRGFGVPLGLHACRELSA